MQPSSTPGVDLIPTSLSLVPSGEKSLNDTGLALVRGLARLPDYWDVVLVDTPPTVGYLSLAPLVASDHVVIPVEAHALALPGTASVVTSIQRAREVLAQLRATFGSVVLDQTVRETIRLAEASALRLSITRYAPWSPAAEDYRAVAKELLARMGGTTTLV